MQYNLETLGDERFQQLCQALLAGVFPTTQCLPVGQRDGGRDAFLRQGKPGKLRPSTATTVFQVKFSRTPSTKDARDLIQETIRTEGKKVKALIERGATTYYLLTNVSGTSYLDSGSIDKAEEELTTAFGLEARCWWRDDIERRIDAQPAVKWSYPEIIRGTDLLQFLCNSSDSADATRRVDTLKALMVVQYRADDKLKFKQIDLQKGISDMFVDVPARLLINDEQKRSEKWNKTISSWMDGDRTISSDFLQIDDEYHRRAGSGPGALQLLANTDFSQHFPLVVVEGAPGQGKSTITQFLCQIHRMMLLAKSDLAKVNIQHRPADVRIPIRIDLRDYAGWVQGLDPFGDEPGSRRDPKTSAVLESFLAALVARHTGRNFSVDDLAAVAKSSQVLIVLDGFDEVADVALRNRIVSEVSDASARIREGALSAQIVITSRPAAFANSPGFPREEFQYIELSSLTPTVILEYSNKWLDGRDTDAREKRDVIRVLQEKLLQPHVRDLARNPMQLAILLNLISVRGASLPDKRTALYDSYIDIFLNREADKSSVVRDHRAVLLKIHRYLAWLLQMEAESVGGGGNISDTRLRSVLLQFLEAQGHSTDLVEALFQGVVERVFVLVSRVQGTFEFEVQPLREYFAARYLYDTAPYSPTGSIVPGTLPERFVGLAKNFYWLNVTRFFAGCYSSGELASLRYGLKQIEEDPRFHNISHLPELIVTLLQDHVFSDQPLLSADMTAWLLKEPLLTLVLAKRHAFTHDAALSVPMGRSRDMLVSRLKEMIVSGGPSDRVLSACRALISNLGYDEIRDFWISSEKRFAGKDQWIWVGQVLDVIERMSGPDFEAVYRHTPDIAFRALIIGRFDLLDHVQSAWTTVVKGAHSNWAFAPFRVPDPGSDIGYFSLAVLRLFSFNPLELRQEMRSDVPFWRFLSRRTSSNRGEFDADRFSRGGNEMFGTAGLPLIKAASDLFVSPMQSVWGAFEKWSVLFNQWSILCGSTGGVNSHAIMIVMLYRLKADRAVEYSSDTRSPIDYAVGIRKLVQTPDALFEHLDRLKSTNVTEYKLILLSALCFMQSEVLQKYAAELSRHLDELREVDWRMLASAYGEMPFHRSEKRTSRLKARSGIDAPSSLRLVALLASRFDPELISWNSIKMMIDYRGHDEFVIDRAVGLLLPRIGAADVNWAEALDFVRHAYGIKKLPMFSFRHLNGGTPIVIPKDVAAQVCANAESYPLDLVDIAERVVAENVGKGAISLAQISGDGSWFAPVV